MRVREGPDAVAAVLTQLDGFEAPAASWETEILPARINEYDPAWLDDLSRAGRVAWARIAAPQASAPTSPVRTTPIVLASRRNLALWTALAGASESGRLDAQTRATAEFLAQHGASFFDEIVDGTGLLRTQIEAALAALTAHGLVTADSFAGLRALLIPSDRRRPLSGEKRRRRTALFGIEDAGRWALVRRAQSRETPNSDAIERTAYALLRRWGVVFWRLLAREADWLPTWRELLRCYRRLEARGEIRGGRFVASFSGEQFAMPEAVGLLREIRRDAGESELTAVSGADPLNLVGLLTPGARLPALTANRVLYRDGIPIARLVAGEVEFLESLAGEAKWTARNTLLRRQAPRVLAFLD